MKRIYPIIIILIVFVFASCKKDPVGPTGPEGAQGSNGLMKQGTIQGTIYGNLSNGDTLVESFNYEYFSDYDESSWYESNGGYGFSLFRRGQNEEADKIEFNINSISSLSAVPDSTGFTISFSYVRDKGNGEYIMFGDHLPPAKTSSLNLAYTSTTLTLSNYHFNSSTGQLKFNYRIDAAPQENYSGNYAYIIGVVDVMLKKQL